jgi:hypothetical protein
VFEIYKMLYKYVTYCWKNIIRAEWSTDPEILSTKAKRERNVLL